jgi:hypothetical protein
VQFRGVVGLQTGAGFRTASTTCETDPAPRKRVGRATRHAAEHAPIPADPACAPERSGGPRNPAG